MEQLEIRVDDDLLLRSWRPTDAEDIVRARDDAAISRWSNSSPVPYLLEHARDFIDATRTGAADRAAAGGAITDARTGKLLGSTALHGIDKRTRIAELGYWSAPWARGRRVTERAARALLTWGFANLDLARTAYAFGNDQPVLDAGPVTLRRPVAKDEAGIAATHRDPESARWFGEPQPYTEAHAREYVRDHVPAEWAMGQEAIFAVVDHADAYAGSIDLRVSPTDPAVGEVGYVIAPQARGRGYATAALRAMSRWGFDSLGLARIECCGEIGNDASRRVAAKAGFAFEGVHRAGKGMGGTRHDKWVTARTAADQDIPTADMALEHDSRFDSCRLYGLRSNEKRLKSDDLSGGPS